MADQQIPSILLYSSIQTLLSLLLIIGFERLIQLPERYHPMTIMRLLAIRMALKVHPDNGRSVFQQRLSGTLAPIVLIFPSLLCLIIAFHFAQFPLFFEGLVVFMCIQFTSVQQRLKRIQGHLQQQKKQLAKHTLQPLVLRETQSLSEMGMAKAAIETASLRFVLFWVTPLLWFVLTDWWLALLFRMTLELHQSWNGKLVRNRHFGAFVAAIVHIMSWLPMQLTSLMLWLLNSKSCAVSVLWEHQCTKWRLLKIFAGSLTIQLGGPVIYNGIKQRYPKVGTSFRPHVQHLAITQRWLNMLKITWLILFLLLTSLMFVIQKSTL